MTLSPQNTKHEHADPATTTITTADSVPLSARVFEPRSEALATAIFTGGIGVPQRVYYPLARWLALQGIRCLTFDYRGFGESRHCPRGTKTASLSAWAHWGRQRDWLFSDNPDAERRLGSFSRPILATA